MANLAEVSQWENVIRQIENGEAATGGADGLANVQAKQLANRTQWLKDKYLPLSGGAMSGVIKATNDSLGTGLHGGTNTENGAHLGLFGRNNTSQGETLAGCFSITTATNPDDNSYCQLIGKMDKSLIWCGTDLAGSAIVAKSLGGNGYIKYASGLIIQWGYVQVSSADTTVIIDNVTALGKTVTRLKKSVYPPLSISKIYSVNCITHGDASRFFMCEAFTKNNYFDMYVLADYTNGTGRSVFYILIGGE